MLKLLQFTDCETGWEDGEAWRLGKRSLGEKVVLVLQALTCFCFWERKGTIRPPDKAELPFCTVHIYRHFRQRWGLEEGYAHGSNQVEFQIAKVFPVLACLKSSQNLAIPESVRDPLSWGRDWKDTWHPLLFTVLMCCQLYSHTHVYPHSHTPHTYKNLNMRICIYVCTNI